MPMSYETRGVLANWLHLLEETRAEALLNTPKPSHVLIILSAACLQRAMKCFTMSLQPYIQSKYILQRHFLTCQAEKQSKTSYRIG